jgi:hypothetical protein
VLALVHAEDELLYGGVTAEVRGGRRGEGDHLTRTPGPLARWGRGVGTFDGAGHCGVCCAVKYLVPGMRMIDKICTGFIDLTEGKLGVILSSSRGDKSFIRLEHTAR